jgi:hypothetical protein
MERFAFRSFSQPSTHGRFDTDAIRLDERDSRVRELPWLEDDRALDPRCHWGQRKCFFTELHFLSEMIRRGLMVDGAATILYIGAGPGEHLPALIDMFPKVNWILYDKTPFHPEIKSARRRSSVTARARFFDDDELETVRAEVREEPLFFLCDMRLSEDDSSVENDMARQMEWGVRLRARAMMLKFRFPFGGPKGALAQDPLEKHNPLRSMLRTHAATRIPFGAWYLAGDLFGQLNAPPNSAESRLIVVCDEDGKYGVRQYDWARYEKMMQGYNYFRRNERYAVPEALAGAVRTVPGYDNGVESLMELTLLDEVRKFRGDNRKSLTDYVVAFEKRLAGLTGKTLSACAIRGYDAGDYKRGPAKLRKKQLSFVHACVGQSLRRKLAFLSARDAECGEDARRWCVGEATELIDELRNAALGRGQSGGGGWHRDPEMEARKILRTFTAEKYIGSAYGSSEVREHDHGTNIFINENIQNSSRERMRSHMDAEHHECEKVIHSETFNGIRLRVYRHGDDTITEGDVERLVSRFQNYYGKIWGDAASNVNVKLDAVGEGPVDAAVPCYLRHRRHAPLSPEQCIKVVAEMRHAVSELLLVRKRDTFSESEFRKLTAATKVAITGYDAGGVGVDVQSLEPMEHYPLGYTGDRILALHTKSDPEMEKWPGWTDGRYIINPWPPIHNPQALSMSSWNLHINKAIVSLFARRKDVVVPLRVQLPRDPDLLYRSFPNSMSKWTYIACIDIPVSRPADSDSTPELFQFCKMVPDNKESPVGYRLFVFKNGGNFGLVSFRSCAVDWGDVVERRGTVYDELCQIIYDVANDDAIQVFASTETGSLSLIVGRKDSITVLDALTPKDLESAIRATGWYDLYCNGSIGTNVRTVEFDGSLWVPVWLTWSDRKNVFTGGPRLAISLVDVLHEEMKPHSDFSFNSYNTRLNTSAVGGGRRLSVGNNDAYGAALQRAFDAFETNRESIPDYKGYINNMGKNIVPGDADLRAVHYKREGLKVLLDGKSRAIPEADNVPPRVQKRFNNDSDYSQDLYPVLGRISPPPTHILVLAHNAYMSSFLLDDMPECSVDLLLHAPSIAHNTGIVLAFEEHYGKRVRVRFGGVCVDSFSVEMISSFGDTRKYDLIVIDITARMSFAEPVAALLRYGPERLLVKRGALMAWGQHPAPDDHVSARLLNALASRFGDVEVQGKIYSWRTHKSDGSQRHVGSHWFLGFDGGGSAGDKDRKSFARVGDELVTALARGDDHAATGADELASEIGSIKGAVQTAIVRHLDKVVHKLAALLKDYGVSGRATGGDGNTSTSALSWSAALLLTVVTVCASTVKAYR